MSEQAIIDNTTRMSSVDTLVADLRALGIHPGATLLVHASLSNIGWVCGGAVAVIQALEQVLTPQGTLVMPTHSGDLSDPAEWQHPPVPQAWWEPIRQTMPAFDPDLTPVRAVGCIPETFRKHRGVLRSNHPQVSFAAWGKHAGYITDHHSLEYNLGESSPLARLYDLDGWVLLLGVGHANNTSLHLAEYRADFPGKKTITLGAPVLVDGVRQWIQYEDIFLYDEDFEQVGADFARETGEQIHGKVEQADTLLIPQRSLVDFAVKWMERNRLNEKLKK